MGTFLLLVGAFVIGVASEVPGWTWALIFGAILVLLVVGVARRRSRMR
jgi:hypothetical protein